MDFAFDQMTVGSSIGDWGGLTMLPAAVKPDQIRHLGPQVSSRGPGVGLAMGLSRHTDLPPLLGCRVEGPLRFGAGFFVVVPPVRVESTTRKAFSLQPMNLKRNGDAGDSSSRHDVRFDK